MSRKIDQALDRLEKSAGLSREGRDWLIASLDPFHDSDLLISGYPDTNNASTVVQLVKRQMQIAVPTSGNGTVAAGNNWDCQINLWPTLNPTLPTFALDFDATGNCAANAAGVSGFAAGGLTASAGPSGTQMWPYAGNKNANNTTSQYMGCSQYLKGNVRVIGMGFEVVNTTAEINKQGQCTVYRIPTQFTPMALSTLQTGNTQAVRSQINGLLCRLPPTSLGDAQLLYGSRSWSAAEGAYVVSRQNSPSNPLLQPSFMPHYYTYDDTIVNLGGTVFVATATSDGFREVANVNSPFDLSGVHFTGLSYTTTLTVNVRWLLERMPGPAEADLVVMATPSSPYDPVALELYSRCILDMPPGVMLSENPLGEWFRSALGAVSKYAPAVGNLVGNFVPGAAALGNAVAAAASSAKGSLPKKKKKDARHDPGPQIVPLKGSASTTKLLVENKNPRGGAAP